jgi:cardiolipin synthase A/B
MDMGDFSTWAGLYVFSEWIIRLVMLAAVPFRRSAEAAKGWLLLILFLPWPGLLLYVLIGRPQLPGWRLAQIKRLRQVPKIFHPCIDPKLEPAVTLAENLGHLPIFGSNSAELLADYNGTIDRLVADIDRAKHHVHLLFYIYADDATAGRVSAALERAVKRGVSCRVLMDALGSRRPFRTLAPRMRAAGIAVHEVLPIGWFKRSFARIDLRNHRKIAVIDGRIGYTGSQNLVESTFKPGLTFEELMVRVEGPVVLALQFVFAADWYLETDEALADDPFFPDPEERGTLCAQALPSGVNYPTQNNQRLFVALIHGAQRRVVITTPYFVPDEAFLQALQTAVLRGVEVHLVLSKQADQFFVSRAQRSFYEELLRAGVRIHLYTAWFLHAKHLSIDDEICIIGSSNMDIRSFALQAEISLILYDKPLTRRLMAEQERYFSESDELTLDECASRPLLEKWIQHLARLLGPLL